MKNVTPINFAYDPSFDVLFVIHGDEEHMISKPIGKLPLDIVWSDGVTTSLQPKQISKMFSDAPRVVGKAQRVA